jgi:hypothetical protein
VDPVPDPLLFSALNRTRVLWICSQELWPLDHRGGPCRQPLTRFPPIWSAEATGSQSTNVVHAWWCFGISSRAVRDVLSNTYHDGRIGRVGLTVWPPCSPDFNPLDFYLWGHIKPLVYAAPVDDEEALHHRIVDVCQTIRNCPSIFEQMRRSKMRRVDAYIEFHGGHFERLL